MLKPSFFARPTLRVARDLLGKKLIRNYRGKKLSGIITEVEAYIGQDDLACHASRGRTRRTEGLYAGPGTLYIYLIYGMYWCLNIVTEKKDFPAAVLIRAVEPLEGIEVMARNRNARSLRRSRLPVILTNWRETRHPHMLKRLLHPQHIRVCNDISQLSNGPGKLCQAFGIDGKLHGKPIGRDTLWIEDDGGKVKSSHFVRTPRIGVDYAKHCAEYPWRFLLKPEA
ncbi:MAG: DNA-3-methyladenine glycosylase [bacterium]|nr:DNA-3-methyladenine glycosylase [bacterium]